MVDCCDPADYIQHMFYKKLEKEKLAVVTFIASLTPDDFERKLLGPIKNFKTLVSLISKD